MNFTDITHLKNRRANGALPSQHLHICIYRQISEANIDIQFGPKTPQVVFDYEPCAVILYAHALRPNAIAARDIK